MIKNYLKVALRNLRKHKYFTTLNVFGLGLSMSICLVIIQLIFDHYQYDRFHPENEQIFRVTTSCTGQEGMFDEVYATSSYRFKEELQENYSFLSEATQLNNSFRGEIRSEYKILDTQSFFADENFFNVLGFQLESGNQETALMEPYSVVLSRKMADLLFPDQNAVGQTVDFEDHGNYKVTGVVATPPGNTHIQFDALASFSTIPVLIDKEILGERQLEWGNIWDNYNYLKLSDKSYRNEAEIAINKMATQNIEMDDDHPGYTFRLEGINEIVPGRPHSNELGFTIPNFALAFFGMLGIIVLITASINYTNLSIAKALTRAKEVGIRKINGARKSQIVNQFLTESILTAFLSLLFAVIIYQFLIRSFNEIWIFSFIGISLEDTPATYLYFVLFALFVGIITGIGPSIFLSRIKALKSLKGSGDYRRKRRSVLAFLTGKRTFLSIQFCLSILMLVTILILNRQAKYFVNATYGFNETEIFYINKFDHDPDLVKQEFDAIPGVQQVAFTSHHPAIGRSHGQPAKRTKDQEPITLYEFSVDPNYIDVMGLELIAGNDFPKDVSSENEKFLIINETAVETYGFESVNSAIGEILFLDTLSLQIIGVIKDYNWEPHLKNIRPLSLRIRPDRYEYAYLKVGKTDIIESKEKFEKAWSEFDPTREYEGGFLNEQLDLTYQFFFDIGNILTYVGMIALSITGLGFLGMVSFEMKSRTKEIGIRKVLGATFKSLTMSLSKGFIIMIVVSSLISIPIALWINGLWIDLLAYKAPTDASIVLLTCTILFSIVGLVILSQVWINANKNPSETLRTE